MISFDQDNRRFKYRVAGLCIHDKYVLLTKADQDDYWILPGGRIELLEDSRATLRRELLEETGYEAQIENPLRIVENFFDLDGISFHELAFVYAFSPNGPTILNNTWTHQTKDGDVHTELQWFELDHLEHVDFQPGFLKPLLRDPLETPCHMIAREPHQK
ncbi:MAG: NUDIX domain-containing protein [Actinomycetota bacterium]|nr:NUDIX domain-containing protein [Actinomycetota bacterium]